MKKYYLLLAIISIHYSNAQMLSPQISKSSNKNRQNTEEFKGVDFYALGSINGSNEDVVNTITASGRLAVVFSPINNLKLNIGANLLNANPANKIKKDSVDFNSLMFPETGNFGFIYNPSFKLTGLKFHSKKNKEEGKIVNKEVDKISYHSLWLDATYSYRKVAIDSPNVNFKVNSVNAGIKYIWEYRPNDSLRHFTFTLIGYWNFFNIPDEDVKKFNTIINDSTFSKYNKNAEIHSIGLKTTVQYKNFLFFADLRRNIKTKELSDNNPLKGTKFNIGFATYLNLKSF